MAVNIVGNYKLSSDEDDMKFLEEVVVGAGGAASVTLNNGGSGIVGIYRHLVIVWTARCDNAAPQNLRIAINADGGSNYDTEVSQFLNTTITGSAAVAQTLLAIGRVQGTGAQAGAFATGEIMFPFYSTTTQDKVLLNRQFSSDGTAASQQYLNLGSGAWRTSSDPITSLVFTPGAGNFVENSRFSLYGVV